MLYPVITSLSVSGYISYESNHNEPKINSKKTVSQVILDLLQKSFSSIDGTGSSAHPTRKNNSCGMG
ncbi:hypothetical protein, partial [Microcoleus sp. B13-B6]|uniref:hypothetical protein n=1 Tax=Microcoleus sp. B13-B6 TaxID=2818652 RepID=UPI002FCE96BC